MEEISCSNCGASNKNEKRAFFRWKEAWICDKCSKIVMNPDSETYPYAEIDVKKDFERHGLKLDDGYKASNFAGVPDFFCEKLNVFIEVKSNTDALSINQIKWISDNPQRKVFIAVVDSNGIIYHKIFISKFSPHSH